MSTESHETSKESEFEDEDQESINKAVPCRPDTPKLGESAFTKCSDMICSNKRSPLNHVDYNGIQKPNAFKFNEGNAYDNDYLDSLYIRKQRKFKRNICSEEQPLDFSRKPVSLDRRKGFSPKYKKFAMDPTMASQGSQENSANSSDFLDDSCDYEQKSELDTVFSHTNGTREPRAEFPMNGFTHTFRNEGDEEQQNLKRRLAKSRENYYKRNGLTAASSSGSEDEFRPVYSFPIRRYQPNGYHSEMKSPYYQRSSEELEKFSHPQHSVSEMLHASNRQPESGSSIAKEKNSRFHMQGIPSRDNQSAPVAEHQEPEHQIDNSIKEQQTSPQTSFGNENNLPSKSTSPCHTENIPPGSSNISPGPRSTNYSVNLPPGFISPNHSMNLPNGYISTNPTLPLPPSRFPFAVTDRLPESNGMIPSYMPTVFPPSHIASFMSHSSPREVPDYRRLYPYPPGAMLPPPLNPMFTPSYQPSAYVGEDQQKQKKQRPFKSIDPSILKQHVSLAETSLCVASSSTYTTAIIHSESNGNADMDSSPQRRSPDSQCLANGSSGNELTQDANDNTGRKKIRKIPPEEKDAKYLEKRRKNNLAAKKSRDERRKKEDFLAISVTQLIKMKENLEGQCNAVRQNLADKEQMLNALMCQLIRFREKCEGRMKEQFEDTFKLYLPPQ